MNDYDFIIPYIIDTTTNSPSGRQLPTQAKKNVGIISINVGDAITSKLALDELQRYQKQYVKSKVNISFCRRKKYQFTDLE